MSLSTTFQIFIIIVTFTMGIITLVLLYQLCTELKKRRKLKELEINLSYQNDGSDIIVLNKIIEDTITEYKIIYLEHQRDLYMTEDMQKKMIAEVLKEVLNSISPITFEKLKYIYNKNVIEDIILKKIRFSVMDYSIEVNGNLQE